MSNNDKISTGIILPVETMEQLDTMARDDRRDRSAEIAYLTEQEWQRRQALQAPTTPQKRKQL